MSSRQLFPCFATGQNEDGKGGGSSSSQDPAEVDLDVDENEKLPSNTSVRSRARDILFSCFGEGKEPAEKSRSESADNKISDAVRMNRATPVKQKGPGKLKQEVTATPPASVTINVSDSPSPPHNRKQPPRPEIKPQSSRNDRVIKKSGSSKNIVYNRIYSNEYDEEFEAVQFLMKIPVTAKPGQTIVNIGGLKDCSMVVPEFIFPGETVVLIVNGNKKKRVISTNSTTSTDSKSSVGSLSSAATTLSSSSSAADEYYAEAARLSSRLPSATNLQELESLAPVEGV